MDKLMEWMRKSVSPKLNKITRNAYIASVQQAILSCMPLILIGSFATLLGIVAGLIEGFPGVEPISNFSMGLLSIFIAFLLPYNIMEKKRHSKTKIEAGILGLSFFLLLCGPVFDGDYITFEFWNLGSGGMIVALVAGILTGVVMSTFSKFSFFKEDSAMPDFIIVWFDTLIPMLILIVIGWLLVYVGNINMFAVISSCFAPVEAVGDGLIGFIVIYWLGYVFLYTFGISTWIIWPLESAIVYTALSVNEAAVAAGELAPKLNVYGVTTYMTIGGGGCTLALAIMFAFMAKSKKNKMIGRASVVPSIFNINEPLVYGAPIAFNPILMIPMWIIGLVSTVLTWLVLKLNILSRISTLWSFWYLPKPINAFVLNGVKGVIFCLVIFALSWMIYYPFFRIYDNQCLEEEKKAESGVN
ncbi:MAG: PTS transporter subunit EIIC [Kineothrix sp.]|nr:PTS transporter subunit EIIC [Kineothrix sp.]